MFFYRDVIYAGFAPGQEARRYDSKDGEGRATSGAVAENNAGAIIEEQKSVEILSGLSVMTTEVR